jgi:hypothetical protein
MTGNTIMRYLLFLFCNAAWIAHGFQPQTTQRRTLLTPAKVGASANLEHDELFYSQMLAKARVFAFSPNDSASSPKEARKFLDEILNMERLCDNGVVTGGVCDNVDEVAMVVAHLREKAQTFEDNKRGSSNIGVLLKPYSLVFAVPMVIPLLLLIAASLLDSGRGDFIPLVIPEEWVWAARAYV